MIQVKNSTIHYINERALTFSENDLNDPMRVAVSLVSGTVIMAYVPGTIDYAADGNYERWTLKGYSTLLVSKEAHFVYARLSRTDRTALIVFSVKDYNIDGSITTVTGKDENGNDITETTDPSADYFYIKIGELTATDGTSSRELTYDSGLLSTKKGDSMTESSNMWELIPGVDPLINALHKLKDFTVKGFITLVGGLKFSKGKEGDEKVIADVKRSVDSDNEYLLGEDGNVKVDELGNPIPDPDYVPVSDDTLPTTKYLHGKLEGFDDKYLRKDQDDRTAHSLSIGGKTTVEGGIQIGSEFAQGMFGAMIDEKGQAELESLVLRRFLEVPELRYNRQTVRMGDSVTSVSAGVVLDVTPETEDEGTLTLKLEDGEFGTLAVDDIVVQIFSDMSEEGKDNNSDVTSDDGKGNRFVTGFATVMFRVIDVSGKRNETIRYRLRPLSDSWKKQVHPFAMGPFGQRGNFENTERQTLLYEGICPKPYTRYMKNVNDWEFTSDMIGMQIGYLGNLSVFGLDMSGYSAYVDNLFYKGFVFELTPQQKAELSAYSVSLTEYVGSIRVDSEGNIIAGEYAPVNVVTGEENVVTSGENVVTGEYLLQTRVQVHKGEKELAYTSGTPEDEQFTCTISGVGCTAGIENGIISITSVEDFSYCYVKVETLCEGKAVYYNTYQVKVIKDGTSAFYADIDNEMDSVACDEKGKVLFGLPVSCNVSAWYGQRQLDILKVELSAPEGVTAVAVQNEEESYTGKVEVSAITAEAADTMQIGITVYAELFGETESRKLTFTVNKVKQGESAVLYKLLPSVDSVKVNDAGTADAENVSCKVLKVTSLGAEELSSLEGTKLSMKYRAEKEGGEKGEFSDYTYLDAVGVDKETRNISFRLYQDGLLIDTETVPVVKDGNAIKEVGEFYLATSYGYGEGVTREDGEWGIWVEGVIPELSKEKKYLWNYEVISYSGIDPTYTEPAIIAMWTEDGKGVKAVYEWYQVNNDKDNVPEYPHVEGDKWVRDTAPVMSEEAKYLWNYEEIHWTDGSITYTEPAMIGAKGETGATTPVLSLSHGTVSRNSLGVFDPATVIVSVRRGVKDDELWLSAFGIRVNEDGTEDAFYLGSTNEAVSRWNVDLNQWSVAIDQNNITSVVFRAYLDFVNSYSDPGIAENGITFVQQGEVGEPGPMPRNRGEYDGSTEYFYNDEYRDYVWKAGGFVYLRQGRGYTGEGASKGAIIGIEPNGTEETEYWVPASVSSLTAINTALIDNADIAGFKFKDNLMVSQDFHYISNSDGGKELDATIILDGETGYFKCTDADVRGSITAGSMSYKIRQGGGDLTGYGMAAGEGDYILPEISEGEILEIKALCTSLRRRADFTFSTQNGDLIYVKSDWGNSFVSSEKVELESNVLYTFTSVYDEDSGKMVWVLSKSLGDANAIDGADGSFIDAEMSETSINPVQNKVITAELKKYVTLAGDTVQTVSRDTDFTGALKVNGSPIVYDKANEYWKLDGDLLVTGAVTMFANEGKYTPSTIMDAVSVDGTTIMNDGTKLYINPDIDLGGGGISSLTINLGNTSYKGTGTSDVSVSLPAYPTSLKNPTELTITLADGTTKTVYDGSTAKSIALTRLWKASEVTSATSDEGTITPLAMNQWTTSRYITAIGTNGNYLTYTKNGVAQNVTVPYATTANQLTKWKVLTIKKNTDAGTVYKLIADLSNWKTGYDGQWGMVGMMYGHRGGNMAGTTIQKIVAYCAAWSSGNGGADYEVKTDITTYVKPCIVSYNGVTYLALRMTSSGSSREHSFLGYTENLLEEFIEVAESAATLVHDTEVMSMGGVNAASASKLQTPRTIWGQSFDGTGNVSGALSGATTGSFSDEVSMKSASIDGIGIYKSSTGVLRIDGDVVLSGALTMFGTDSVNTSTIMDGVNVDGTTIIKSGNKLMINPDLELGGGLDESALASYLNSWSGSSSIKNVGTITSGTWNGSKIANAYLANSAVTISGESVSLGGSLSQSDLRTALGLGSNAYTSTSYLPSASYTAADVLAKLKTVDGADSGLDADLLDGYHVSRFPLLNAVCGSSYDLNNADRAGYYNVSMSTNRPSEAYGYGMMETIEVYTGVSDSEKRTLQVYYPHQVSSGYKYYGMAVRMRNGASNAANNVWGDWRYFVTKDGNVASATTASKLATERTIWGQSFDGSGDITGHLYLVGANASSSTGNTSQILFGTTSSHHLALSSNTNALIINPTSSSTTGQIVLGVNGKSSYFTSSGNFGIGTSTPSSKLHVAGNLLTTGGITMYGSSDKRLKKNIRSFQAGKELMSLGGVYQFEYEDEEISRNGMYKGTHVGLIYQNVKGTILDKMCYERGDGYGALNYLDSSFISLLAGVGMEHETRIQRLERENEELRKEIEQLKSI